MRLLSRTPEHTPNKRSTPKHRLKTPTAQGRPQIRNSFGVYINMSYSPVT
jgi:phosphopantetheinyl transferase